MPSNQSNHGHQPEGGPSRRRNRISATTIRWALVGLSACGSITKAAYYVWRWLHDLT